MAIIMFIEKKNIQEQTKKSLLIYYTNAILQRRVELSKQDRKEYIKKINQRNLVNNIRTRSVKGFLKFIYYKVVLK